MRLPKIKIHFAAIKAVTAKAYLMQKDDGTEQWVPSSICKIIRQSEHSGVDCVIAPFFYERITGRVPQPLDTPSMFQRSAHAGDLLDGPIEIDPPVYELLAHQKECVGKFIKQNKAALFMDMGTGKTITALCLAHSWKQAGLIDTIIVVCPVSLKANWRIKSEEYYGVVPDFVLGSESLSHDASYERISQCVDEIDLTRAAVIVDESHFFKYHDVKRSQRLHGCFSEAAFKLVLTGTPITQSAADLFMQLGFLAFDILGFDSYAKFEKQHLLLNERNKIVGYTGIEEVTAKASPYVYQIKSEECLDLPPKRYDVLSFDLLSEQREAYSLVQSWFGRVREKSPQSNEVLGLMVVLQMIASGFVPDMNALASRISKSGWNIPESVLENMGYHVPNERVSLLNRIVDENQEQYVIFYRFRSEREILKQRLKNACFLDGKTPVKDRQKIVEKFRAKKIRLIVCQIQVGGIGFDLETSANIVFYSTDWSLAHRIQAEGRCWRKGQTRQVRIIDLVASGTIEEEVARCIARKKDIKHAFESEIQKITGVGNAGDDTDHAVGRQFDEMEAANKQMELAY